jgi:hypothetical protein
VYDAAVPRVLLLIALVVALVVAALGRTAAAAPCGDAAAWRADLEGEARRADHWVLAWRIAYTATAVGQLAAAASGAADRDNTQALWVGGVKSTIAALGVWLSPLRVHVPRPIGDTCADLNAVRAAAERAARDEAEIFWTGHIGGLILNAGGGLVVAERVSWQAGLLSFATGYAVGLLNVYTMPRASWRRMREQRGWTAGITSGDGRHGFVVAGSF